MSKTINVGIIGAGIVGERVIKALQKHERGNILGVFDVNEERSKYICGQYHLEAVKDYKELLNNQEIDVVYLAVPPKYHHSIALEIIKANKHIICEKPLANSISEAKEMLEAAEKQGVVHAMNFPTVYTPAFKRMKALLDEGFLGTTRRIELKAYFPQWPRPWQQTDWIGSREQGGFVREVFTHFVQMIGMVLGEIVDIDTNIEYPEDSLACETGIIATAALKNGTPILFNGFSDVAIQESLALTLYGTEGTISMENWRELWTSSKGEARKRLELEETDHLLELIDEVFKAIEKKEASIITFEAGYHAQIVIEELLARQ
ncbi:putative dehydrogenase [Alkaliphilus hydrothermalis]|uniref:Dehydrogenase n=2 Tax=Alkaliphilus hydrothermalis TaxID=1482730 RepID=A0ABS2NPU1_9FIRM|nr:putative dehydrogenase [Alkaliphilus hydrothermalis]